ncbi:hypothetical protein MOD67_14280 [Bacillus licheniformis]|uniref:hypothetical protein n=1 Tax=Bacillus TaxID=1386 RepID=UPI002282F914|nr:MULTISPECIES: hypothetical protein [Bacillus]MCY7861191.1 hypothetical protein [Bacillus haynesii]MCY8015481.1 hypothetical protein [Bacillus haynesii]MCY8291480.1 hypothetical protein [Bacillus haynesii]MCY8549103.1 hypothetical protein [Bacillus haynesii]MCY8745148.1 hypothetical protein [Bacillus licheniformis]
MKVSDILTELSDLERRQDEINVVLSQASLDEADLGEAGEILQKGLEKNQRKLTTFLNSEFEPSAAVLFLTVTPSTATMNAEETTTLSVIATLSNGSTKNVTSPRKPVMFFRDFNDLANNKGFITSVNIEGYGGDENTFEIIKTSGGFDVDDSLETQGLQVVPTSNENEYKVVDFLGESLGIVFKTNGEEEVGDNWLVDIYLVGTGTSYEVDDPSLAAVDENGVITALGGGDVTVTVRNGQHVVDVPITIIDTVAPEPPIIESVTPLPEAVEISFDPSTSPDVVSYNLYVDGVQKETGIVYDGNPFTYSLTPADGETIYTVTMTAVDGSGNESEHSPAKEVSPLPPEEVA